MKGIYLSKIPRIKTKIVISVLFHYFVSPFIVESNSNETCKPVREGMSNDKKHVVLQIAQSTNNSNLESASVVQDFDSIFQNI